jgi:1-acyl-sn-glycerol-3-phosphate acyltransferase
MSRSLYTTFGIRRILRPINRSLKTHGFSPTLKKIVENCTRKFIINLPSQTQKTLKKDPVLLICNHPAQADVLLLMGAVPPRPKTFLVAMHGLMSILPHANKHLIPVCITHRIDSESQHDWKFKLFQKFHFVPEYSKEIAHQKNVDSIARAARKIDKGSLVAIFPAGGTLNNRDFLPGVGHLIKNLKYPRKTKLVMAHVEGTSAWDFFRVLPYIGKLLPKFKIDFSEVQEIKNYTDGCGREISQKLQQTYDSWAGSFKRISKIKYAALYLRSLLLFLLIKG